VALNEERPEPASVREARLRPEYAEEYPAMTPGVWMPVRELARLLIDRVYTRRREGRPARTFDPTHFEFRGGDRRSRLPATRTRSTDGASDPERPGTRSYPAGRRRTKTSE
jgi:hypothetical protein